MNGTGSKGRFEVKSLTLWDRIQARLSREGGEGAKGSESKVLKLQGPNIQAPDKHQTPNIRLR